MSKIGSDDTVLGRRIPHCLRKFLLGVWLLGDHVIPYVRTEISSRPVYGQDVLVSGSHSVCINFPAGPPIVPSFRQNAYLLWCGILVVELFQPIGEINLRLAFLVP